MPLLTNDLWRKWLAECVDAAIAERNFRLVAFVFMPEHVHLLAAPPAGDDTPRLVSSLLAAIKRPLSARVKAHLETTGGRLVRRLTIRTRPGTTAFRFWQEGPGYDRNLPTESAVLAAMDYIHHNPVKRGLTQRTTDWKWSSARWYASDRAVVDADLPTIHGLPAEFFGPVDRRPL